MDKPIVTVYRADDGAWVVDIDTSTVPDDHGAHGAPNLRVWVNEALVSDREQCADLAPVPDALAPLAAELKEAREVGRQEAHAAAAWTVDGNTPRETVRDLLAGIEDGDPEILDRFEAPNLSGEMADARTPDALARELGLDGADLEVEAFDAVCAAYEAGVEEAFLPAVEAELRRALGGEAGS